MKRTLITLLIPLMAITFIACGGSKSGKVLVKVGSKSITEGDLETLGNINPRIKTQMSTDFGKRKILDNLVEQELFYQASVKEGLNRDPAVKEKIDIYRKVIISQAYLDEKLKEAAQKYYDEHKDEFEKLKLSHIEIKFKKGKIKRSEKEALNLANKAKERVTGGEDFAKVAMDVSEDNLTAKRGGDLGFASKNEPRLVRRGFGPVLEKAFTMKVGEVEGPIKTEEGYHIIIVTKEPELQPFDQASQGILFKLRGKIRGDTLADLKKKYKVEYAKREAPMAPAVQPRPAAPVLKEVPNTKVEELKLKEKVIQKAKKAKPEKEATP